MNEKLAQDEKQQRKMMQNDLSHQLEGMIQYKEQQRKQEMLRKQEEARIVN